MTTPTVQPENINPREKLEGLPAEAKNKVGSIWSGMQSLQRMNKALQSGYGPEYVDSETPFLGGLISDTPFTENRRILSEVIGRLQSGGAINPAETKQFNALSPRPGDDPATVKRKIAQQDAFLENKLTAFGFNKNEAASIFGDNQAQVAYEPQNTSGLTGLSPRDQVPYNPTPQPNLGGDAIASPEVILSPERAQARQIRLQQLRAKAQGGQ